jgi:hypothetical protein
MHTNGYAYYYANSGISMYVLDRGGGMSGTGNWINVSTLSGPYGTCSSPAPKFQSMIGGTVVIAGTGGLNEVFHRQTTPSSSFTHISAAPTGALDILSAFGRLWAINYYRLYWSALLDETTWGASDYIDLGEVFPDGADQAVGLAEYNGFLLIFGSHSIVIYQNPDQVAAGNMTKVETIKGVGMLNRDLIQDVGTDMIFMSNGGLVSLNRVIQEKSMPMNMVGEHVFERMMEDFNPDSWYASAVSSAYDRRTGTIWMRLSSTVGGNDTAYWLIDVKHRTPEGTLPRHRW